MIFARTAGCFERSASAALSHWGHVSSAGRSAAVGDGDCDDDDVVDVDADGGLAGCWLARAVAGAQVYSVPRREPLQISVVGIRPGSRRRGLEPTTTPTSSPGMHI